MNHKKTILFSLFFISLLTCSMVYAEAPELDWQHNFGDEGTDISFSHATRPEGGYALACLMKPRGADRGDLYLVLTDQNGESVSESLLYEKCSGSSIQNTLDGGYIVCGTISKILVSEAMVLVKTDADGDVLWSREYYDSGGYQPHSVEAVSTGGYIVTGIRWKGPFEVMNDPNHQDPDAFLVRVDDQGEVLWNYTYGGLYDDRGFSVIKTDDSGFLLAGSTRPDDSSLDLGYLVKTDSRGMVEWSQTYGDEEGQRFNSVCIVDGGGYAAAGFTLGFGSQGSDYYLVRVDDMGELVWSRHYGGSGDDEAFDLVSVDGGFVLVGGSSVAMGSDRDVGVIRTDSEGEVLWEAAYGGGDHDIGYSITLAEDGGYVVSGETRSYGSSYQIHLIKLEAEKPVKYDSSIPGFSFVIVLISLFCYSLRTRISFSRK